MQSYTRMRRFVVVNRTDKDGEPIPVIQISLETDFAEGIVNELATMTGGKNILLQMDLVQPEMKLSSSGSKR